MPNGHTHPQRLTVETAENSPKSIKATLHKGQIHPVEVTCAVVHRDGTGMVETFTAGDKKYGKEIDITKNGHGPHTVMIVFKYDQNYPGQ
jgi:hypothetical protein